MKLRVPNGLSLFKNQPEGVRHLMGDKNRLLLDDMGFGKTCQSVVAANSLGLKKNLVICPPSVRFQWGREYKKWSIKDYHIHVTVGTMDNIRIKDRSVVVCPYNLLLSPMIFDQLKGVKWGSITMDEIQNCKGTSQRTEAVLGRTGLWKNSVYRWGLSGTPITTTPIDLWPIAKTLGRKVFDMSWMTFTRKYCGRYRSKYGWDVKGATNLGELRSKLFDTGLALRREAVDLPGNQLRFQYIHEQPQAWSEITDRIDTTKTNFGLSAADISTARIEAADAKAEYAVQYVIDKCTGGKKTVVFTWHRHVTEQIARELEPHFWQVEKYYGGMTPRAKERALNEFIYGDADILVANLASAGTGLDGLQTVCSHCVYAEVPWNFTDIIQAYRRLARTGQLFPVVGDILLIGGSTEDHLVSGIVRKEGIFDTVFNN